MKRYPESIFATIVNTILSILHFLFLLLALILIVIICLDESSYTVTGLIAVAAFLFWWLLIKTQKDKWTDYIAKRK